MKVSAARLVGGLGLAAALLLAMYELPRGAAAPTRGAAATLPSRASPAAAREAVSARPGPAMQAGQRSSAAAIGPAPRPLPAYLPESSGSTAASLPAVAADAAQSLADALRNGDSRSPPIVADDAPRERASAADLADAAAYRRYENRQQARLYRAFEQEATIALGDLQRDLQRARSAGIPAEQLAEGEEKERRLAETLQHLRQGDFGQ